MKKREYLICLLHYITGSLAHQALFFCSSLHSSYHVHNPPASVPQSSPEVYQYSGAPHSPAGAIALPARPGTDGLYSIALDYREGNGRARRLLPFLYNQTAVEESDLCLNNTNSLIHYNVTILNSSYNSQHRLNHNHAAVNVEYKTSHNSTNGYNGYHGNGDNGYNGKTMAGRKVFNGNGNGGRRNGKIPPLRDLRIKSLSHDPISGRVLLQIIAKDESRFTLGIGQTCESNTKLTTNNCTMDNEATIEPERYSKYTSPDSIYFPPAVKTLFFNAKTLEHARIGPVGIYNKSIYFLLQRKERPDYRTKLNVIELRLLTNVCKDGDSIFYPVTSSSSSFDVLECSVVIANVTREVYDKYYFYRPLDSLAIAPSDNGDSLHFYFQIQRLANLTSTSVDISIQIYHACHCPFCQSISNQPNTELASSEAELPVVVNTTGGISCSWAELVHDQPVSSAYFKFDLLQLGGVSWRGGLLCWAPIDRIMCGRMARDTGHVDTIRTFLGAGEAEQVCRVTPGDGGLRGVITGLAVAAADTREEIAVYFGCVAQKAGLGGGGLLRIRHDHPTSISPLRLPDGSYLRAGGMFIMDECGSVLNGSVTNTSTKRDYLFVIAKLWFSVKWLTKQLS